MLYACGRLEIDLSRRELRADGVVVPLGSRAFDSLEVLVRTPGRLVTRDEFMDAVWPNQRVEANTLQVHVSALRNALGPDRDLLRTVSGRGYRLLGNWITVRPSEAPGFDTHAAPRRETPVLTDQVSGTEPEALLDRGVAASRMPGDLMGLSSERAHNLPVRVVRSVGRDGVVRAISAQLATGRFVSVIGPGGIGKTTVAVMVGHALLEAFNGSVQFVDLGPVSDPSLVPYAVASTLGLAIGAEEPISGITTFLRDRHMLLILDSCEHMVETAAALAERIYQEAPRVQVLTTSRETLRVAGEHVYMLLPLECPPENPDLTAVEAHTFSAVQLFVERAAAIDNSFRLTDADAPVVAEMCRTVDGVALAIEFAAGRAGVFGVRETARLLKGRFSLLWQGRRTALPRHRTLAAALDWSHALLTEAERIVLRRLSIFAGVFVGLEPALAVAADESLRQGQVIDAIDGLVAKSLVAPDFTGLAPRYRLLDTTRAYAAGKLADADETRMVARRHAVWFRDFLSSENGVAADQRGSAPAGDHVANVRAALEWSFGDGDMELATALAAEAAPLFLRLSLLSECNRWTERAIAMLDEASRGTKREMRLLASLGEALMFTKGNGEHVRAALERGLAIAEDIDDLESQGHLLGWLTILHLRMCDFHSASSYARRSAAAAARFGDPTAIAAAAFLGGSCNFFLGRNEDAYGLLTVAIEPSRAGQRGSRAHFAYNYRQHALSTLALNLWILGHADKAERVALQTVEEAANLKHPVTLCIALTYAVTVFMWAGDYRRATEHLLPFVEHAERHLLTPYQASGMGVKGEIEIRSGRSEEGIAILSRALEALQRGRYEMRTTAFTSAIAEGQASIGRFGEAMALIEGSIQRAERIGDLHAMPEMLRIKGDILACMPGADLLEAEAVLRQSLALAKSQSALAWQLRTAMSLARLWQQQGRIQEAERLLAPVYGRFTEGFATADLRAAERLLKELGGSDQAANGLARKSVGFVLSEELFDQRLRPPGHRDQAPALQLERSRNADPPSEDPR